MLWTSWPWIIPFKVWACVQKIFRQLNWTNYCVWWLYFWTVIYQEWLLVSRNRWKMSLKFVRNPIADYVTKLLKKQHTQKVCLISFACDDTRQQNIPGYRVPEDDEIFTKIFQISFYFFWKSLLSTYLFASTYFNIINWILFRFFYTTKTYL